MAKNALIVGMARSGTSMTTRIFTGQGYFVAEDEKEQLREADHYNPSGYWEAQPLIDANVDVFKAVGFEHDNTWMFDAISAESIEQVSAVKPFEHHRKLVDNYNQHSPWVWKDPRLCYTLNYWWPLLDQNNSVVILLTRKPEEIYQSFVRLKWRESTRQDKDECYQRIADHISHARKVITEQNIPFVEVDYSDFETQPQQTVDKLNQFFDLSLSLSDLGYDKSLNHKGIRGKLIILSDRLAEKMPSGLRRFIKSLLPNCLLKNQTEK